MPISDLSPNGFKAVVDIDLLGTGIDALSRACAIEWGPDGVRVNTVAPGAMPGTEGVRRIAGDDQHRVIQNPLRRAAVG